MKQFRKGLLLIDKWVSIVCMIADLVILFVNVVGRYVFLHSIPWAEEIGRYLMIIMIYLGISYSAHHDSHIRIDSVEKLYPPKALPYIRILSNVIWVFYCGIITYYGLQYTAYIFETHARMVAVNLPLWPIYATIPLGHFLMGIRVLFLISDQVAALRGKSAEGGAQA